MVIKIIGRLWRWDRQLINLQRGQLGRDQVGYVARIVHGVALRDWELRSIHARIEMCPAAVHLEIRDVRIPIRHAAPTGVSVQVLSG